MALINLTQITGDIWKIWRLWVS